MIPIGLTSNKDTLQGSRWKMNSNEYSNPNAKKVESAPFVVQTKRYVHIDTGI